MEIGGYMKLDDYLTTLSGHVRSLVQEEYVEKKVVLAVLKKWASQIEIVSWGAPADGSVTYGERKYVAADILKDLESLCQTSLKN